MKRAILMLFICSMIPVCITGCKKEEPVQEEATGNDYLDQDLYYDSSVGSMTDPFSGDIAIGSTGFRFHSGSGPSEATGLMGIDCLDANIDGTATSDFDTSATPTSGSCVFRFCASDAGNQDVSVVEVTYGAPFDDLAGDDSSINNYNIPLGDFKVKDISFNVMAEDGSAINPFTLPNSSKSITTRDELVASVGESNLVSDDGGVISFSNVAGDTAISDITAQYNTETGAISNINVSYNVNYGVDFSEYSDSNAANIEYDTSPFDSAIISLPSGSYYGFWGSGYTAEYMFVVTDPMNIDLNTMTGFVADVYGISDGVPSNFATVNSSAADNKPIAVSSDGYIYCASNDKVMKIYVDTYARDLVPNSEDERVASPNGGYTYSSKFNDGEPSISEDSYNFDVSMSEYASAIPVVFYQR